MYVDAGIADTRTRTGEWWSQLLQEMRCDALFYTIIVSYFAVMLCLSQWSGRQYWLIPTAGYFSCFLGVAALFCIASFTPAMAGHLVRTRPSSPLGASLTLLGQWATPARVAGLCLYLALAVFMGAFTTVKTILPDIRAFWFDPTIAGADRVIHGGVDPWRLIQPFLGLQPVTRAIEVLYSAGWLLLTAWFPLAMAAFAADRSLRNRYLLAFLLGWIVNGTVLACVFMSGGPVFYAGLTGDAHRYGALVNYLAFDLASPISAAREQADLWAAYLSRGAGAGAGISAFPSMHVTMAVLIACAGAKLDRRLGMALAAFAAVIVVGSVHLGWHYAVGSYYAVVSSLALWWAAGRIVRMAEVAGR